MRRRIQFTDTSIETETKLINSLPRRMREERRKIEKKFTNEDKERGKGKEKPGNELIQMQIHASMNEISALG